MKNITTLLAALVIAALQVGCDNDRPNAFVGHWTEITKEGAPPMTLDISLSNNVFHIDERKNLFGKNFERKLEGSALSDTTLSIFGGALTMRLENNRLHYSGRELVKSP
ncbi:hypothetical protein PflA506_p0040 (plasmid) [Pseudomonas fluorescens A506]|nr:hypothetical protein PflA506_p0040 [Pseudomonas fluorescens A506]